MLCAHTALALVGLIGGRIIPSFTLTSLRKAGRPVKPKPLPGADRAAVLLLVGVVPVDLVAPGTMLAGG